MKPCETNIAQLTGKMISRPAYSHSVDEETDVYKRQGLSRWQKCSAEGGGAKEAAPANIAVNYYAAKFRNSNYLEGKTPVAGLEVMVY